DKKVIVYPNPTSDLVHFDFEAEESMIVEFVLSDVSGKLTDRFYTTRLPKGRNLISFSTQHLNNGLYFVKMLNYDTKKVLYTEKVIIP
ncbi:MAG: T9SS type A sorting domain-containing protein, partial [Bacteroidales bacterium]|nr:T9SS type A sorting domain-containing protein [Bacteroidales bacterium]